MRPTADRACVVTTAPLDELSFGAFRLAPGVSELECSRPRAADLAARAARLLGYEAISGRHAEAWVPVMSGGQRGVRRFG